MGFMNAMQSPGQAQSNEAGKATTQGGAMDKMMSGISESGKDALKNHPAVNGYKAISNAMNGNSAEAGKATGRLLFSGKTNNEEQSMQKIKSSQPAQMGYTPENTQAAQRAQVTQTPVGEIQLRSFGDYLNDAKMR